MLIGTLSDEDRPAKSQPAFDLLVVVSAYALREPINLSPVRRHQAYARTELTPSLSSNLGLSVSSPDHSHQFRYLFPLIDLVAACNRVFDAVRHVISEHFFLDAPQRGTHCRDLRDDIDAIAVLIDHPGEAADLPFDPAEAFLAVRLDVFSHRAYIPLLGTGCKCTMESSMTEAKNVNAGGASKGSGCGCASRAAAALAAETPKAGCCGGGHDHSAHGHDEHHSGGNANVREPVCGMAVAP